MASEQLYDYGFTIDSEAEEDLAQLKNKQNNKRKNDVIGT